MQDGCQWPDPRARLKRLRLSAPRRRYHVEILITRWNFQPPYAGARYTRAQSRSRRSRARRGVWLTPARALILLANRLRIRLAIGIEALLAPLLPRCL